MTPLPFTSIRTHCAAVLTLVLALAVLPACHLPTPLKELDEPRLISVQAEYRAAVHLAHNHPTQTWYSGWFGNFRRNWLRGNSRGLCYEWQAIVYESVREAVPAAGFDAIGIMKDRDKSTEHHAVLVYETGTTTGPALLEQREGRRAWVLDAWRYGNADIFSLDDWLGAEFRWRGHIEFEDLEAEYQERLDKAERRLIETTSQLMPGKL